MPHSGGIKAAQTGHTLGIRPAAFGGLQRHGIDTAGLHQEQMMLPVRPLPIGSYLLQGGWRSDCWNPSTALYFLYIKQKCAASVSFFFRSYLMPSHK